MSPEQTDFASRRAAPRLRPYVDRYQGYRMTGLTPGVHRGLPSRHLTLIVSIGPAIDVVAQTDRRQEPDSYGAVLGGLQASPALIAYGAVQEGVAVELTPLGSRAVLGMPAGALWDRSLELSDALGDVGDELWERLQGPGSWENRFAVCDEVLSRRLTGAEVPAPLAACWRRLVASAGRVRVEALAAAAGWSRQHLARCFRDEFGTGPKVAARILRFERARHLLAARASSPTGIGPDLADVALRCGYYDQSHLDRDFSRFAGCPPTRWLADEVPFVQDGGTDGMAGSLP